MDSQATSQVEHSLDDPFFTQTPLIIFVIMELKLLEMQLEFVKLMENGVESLLFVKVTNSLNNYFNSTCYNFYARKRTFKNLTFSGHDCPPLKPPEHGAIVLGKKAGGIQTASFSCDDGFHIDGGHMLTCMYDGTWDETVPDCLRNSCASPPE